jgi:hypothetical protein
LNDESIKKDKGIDKYKGKDKEIYKKKESINKKPDKKIDLVTNEIRLYIATNNKKS